MKRLVQAVVALLVILVLLVVAAGIALPKLLDTESVRSRIQQAARDALGREVGYEDLEVGLLPPSLRVLRTTVSGATREAPPLLEAREISLRVAIWPLLFGTVLVDSLVVDGATLRLVRTPAGIELPAPTASSAAAPERPAGAKAAEGDSGGVDLAVRDIRLRDTTLLLTDRTVKPPVRWELRDVAATASGSSLDAPIAIDVEATLGSGGGLSLDGTAARSGVLDLRAKLDDVVIDALAPYLGGDIQVAGRIGGSATIAGPARRPEKLTADLHGSDVHFRRADVDLRGAVDVRADIADPAGAADGHFEADATRAALAVEGGFTKPEGTPATVTGRVTSSKSGGLAFDDVHLRIKNFEATGRVSSLDPLRAEASAGSFDLAGWEALVPALADSPPTGRLSLEGLSYQQKPASLGGTLTLKDVVLHSKGAAPLALSGALRGKGRSVVSEGLVVRTGSQTLNLDARLDDVFSKPRYDVGVRADGADSNSLLTTLLAKPDTLYGPLAMNASFRGPLGGNLLSSLRGRIDFGIEKGRLVGVSLLRAAFDRLGAVGSLALDLGKAFGGRDLQRFYGDEFELLKGVLDVENGVAHTDDLRFVYRGYGVTLRGTLGLADLALDMRGQLTLDEELDGTLARELGLPDSYQPRKRTLELASVGGTLGAPRVRLASDGAVRFAAAYAGDRYRDQLRKQVEGQLGKGSGEAVDQGIQVLEGILGGRKRNP